MDSGPFPLGLGEVFVDLVLVRAELNASSWEHGRRRPLRTGVTRGLFVGDEGDGQPRAIEYPIYAVD